MRILIVCQDFAVFQITNLSRVYACSLYAIKLIKNI